MSENIGHLPTHFRHTNAGEIGDGDTSMQENQSSDQSMSEYDILEGFFPCLGPLSQEVHDDITFILDNLGRNYLTDMSTESTQEIAERLPRLVNSVVQSLSRITGCLMSARVVSFNYQERDSVKAYSTVTNSIRGFMDPKTSQSDMGVFLDLAFRETGQSFERQPMHLFPVVYTSPAWRGRPVLCPKHPLMVQQRENLKWWLSILRQWQGLGEINWEDIAQGVAQGGSPPIAPTRAPPNLPWHIHIDEWPDDDITSLYDWILTSQRRVYAGDAKAEDTAPQFIENSPDEAYRKEGFPSSEYYSEHSAYYYQAMQHYRFDDNIYIMSSKTSPRWFPPSLINAWSDTLTSEVKTLLHFVEANESLLPPKREVKESDPPLLLCMPADITGTYTELNTILNNTDIPVAIYKWNHPQYNKFNIRAIWSFVVEEEGLLVEGKVAGGPTGAVSVALALFILLRVKDDLAQGRISSSDENITWGPVEDHQISQIVVTLTQQIKQTLETTVQPSVHSGLLSDSWLPSKIVLKVEHDEDTVEYTWPHGPFGKGGPLVWGNDDGSDSIQLLSPKVAGALPGSGTSDVVLVGTSADIIAPVNVIPTAGPAIPPNRSPPSIHKAFLASNYGAHDLAGLGASAEADGTVSALSKNSVLALDDDPWRQYPNSFLITGSLPSGKLVDTKAVFAGPSTERLQSASLPRSDESGVIRRSQSLDPGPYTQGLFESRNTLGLNLTTPPLVPGQSLPSVTSGDSSLGAPSSSSTPYQTPRDLSKSVKPTSKASSTSRSPRASSRARTVSSSSTKRARSKTPIVEEAQSQSPVNMEGADTTVTGSMLDLAARVFTDATATGTSSGNRQPAVTAVRTRRIVTRHGSQAVAAKRALPEDNQATATPGAKKSRSTERESGRK